MRIRPLAALAPLALAGVLLAGCSVPTAPEPTPTTAPASADVCENVIEPGAAAEDIAIEGDFGTASQATFALNQEVSGLQRVVVKEGDGPKVSEGDYVRFALSAFDGATGERIGDAGYAPGELLPTPMSAGSQNAQLLGCESVGTRLAAVFPAMDGAAAQFYVVDILEILPMAAWGAPQEPAAGMPAVTLDQDGAPTVTVPDAAAPTELTVSVLKKGDGEVVADGDTSILQYHGVDWETGEVFDSSWANGAPISIPGNGYVPGFTQAINGQPEGTQLVVAIPPALGYGEAGDDNTHELAGKTLIFVIDILATQHGAAQ